MPVTLTGKARVRSHLSEAYYVCISSMIGALRCCRGTFQRPHQQPCRSTRTKLCCGKFRLWFCFPRCVRSRTDSTCCCLGHFEHPGATHASAPNSTAPRPRAAELLGAAAHHRSSRRCTLPAAERRGQSAATSTSGTRYRGQRGMPGLFRHPA